MNQEHWEAVALLQWWAIESNRIERPQECLMAIPNQGRGGGWRNARRGSYMKKEGLRAGAPDYFLAIPVHDSPGLFIELKAKGGRVSDSQKRMSEILKQNGYRVFVCYGWEEAKECIQKYLRVS